MSFTTKNAADFTGSTQQMVRMNKGIEIGERANVPVSIQKEAAAGSEEKGPTEVPPKTEEKEPTEAPPEAEEKDRRHPLLPMAASPASGEGTAESKEKEPTSTAGGGSLRARELVLTSVMTVAVSILLLVRFHGHPMPQVWIMSVSICSLVFIFHLCIWRSRWFFKDLDSLSYGPLLAFFSANMIGSATATFVLLFSTVWAAGNLGYSLAVHRMCNGTETAIHAVPSPSFNTKDSVKEFNFNICIGAPFAMLAWTLFMVMIINVAAVTNELDILTILSYFGWVHVAVWVFFLTQLSVHGVLLQDQMEWLLPGLVLWTLISPAINFISQILAVLCHFLLVLALVAFLWYNLAIYIHFLGTATPSTTTQENEDTLHREIQAIIEQVMFGSTLEKTPLEAELSS